MEASEPAVFTARAQAQYTPALFNAPRDGGSSGGGAGAGGGAWNRDGDGDGEGAAVGAGGTWKGGVSRDLEGRRQCLNGWCYK